MPRLVSLYRLKELAGVSVADTSQDAYLGGLADAASEVVEAYLRRHVEQKERTETLHQQGGALRLKAYPVASVACVKTAGAAVPATEYQIDAETGLIRRPGGWPYEPEGYEVKYTGGLTDPYPMPLQQAALMVALQLRAMASQGGQGAASERIGDYSITYLQSAGAAGLEALNPAAAALLRPYVGGAP